MEAAVICISVIESNIAFPCYLGKCHAASTEGINYAVLYTRILVRLYTYFHFLQDLLTCGKLSFLRRIFTIVAKGQKECGSWWCKRGLSVLKVVCANCFLLADLETFQSFWNISDPLFSLFGVLGKMMPPSLLLHVPFSSTFQDTLVVVAASHAASIYWHNWAFFSKSDLHSDYDSVLVYPNNLTIIIMTSTLWTSLNSKKMLTKHLNDVTRCKKDADVHRHLPTMATILFPHFKEACWLRKFEQYRGCIVGLLCGFSLRDYSWW